MNWDFSAAVVWNSSSIFIHKRLVNKRFALGSKPAKVASVYSSQSEIIHVLLCPMRSWRKLSVHTHWHIFGAFHTSQWNYTRNMNLAHTVCTLSCPYTDAPWQTLPFKFQNKPFKAVWFPSWLCSVHFSQKQNFTTLEKYLWILPLWKNIWRGFNCFEYWDFWNLSNCHDCCV